MSDSQDHLVRRALAEADETKALVLGRGVLNQVATLFASQFGAAPAVIIADSTTFDVAGRRSLDLLKKAGQACEEPLIFSKANFRAEYRHAEQIEAVLRKTRAIPVAVGSGTLNDLTKRAAHQTGRPYMAVATAASMDGYTAFGASITFQGSKQTFSCPAPQAVLADMDIISQAPTAMTASGYADLLSKVTAGADWLLADALGEEKVDPIGWGLIQDRLRHWLSEPEKIRNGDPLAIARLMEGLLLGGFAMQRTKSSRCASGAEHQFSHLWDMEHHTHQGMAPSHGFKVGVATLAVTHLYEALLAITVEDLDLETAVASWPTWAEQERTIRELYGIEEIRQKAVEESRAKYVDHDALRRHLERARAVWPDLREKLKRQLLTADQVRRMLAAVGAPASPEEIGISPAGLTKAFRQAQPIRRRYTVLDFVVRSNLLKSLCQC